MVSHWTSCWTKYVVENTPWCTLIRYILWDSVLLFGGRLLVVCFQPGFRGCALESLVCSSSQVSFQKCKYSLCYSTGIFKTERTTRMKITDCTFKAINCKDHIHYPCLHTCSTASKVKNFTYSEPTAYSYYAQTPAEECSWITHTSKHQKHKWELCTQDIRIDLPWGLNVLHV